MAINFLIALATALASATLILLALYVVLKVFAPNAFNEMIPVDHVTVESPLSRMSQSQDAVGEQASLFPGPPEISRPTSYRLALAQVSPFFTDLSSVPLFMGLSPSDRREIISAAHEKHFARRQPIFLEGDPVQRVVLLTSGSAKIVQVGQSGTEMILGVRGPGEVVGTVGLRLQDRHSSTAMALAPSTALVWDAAAFETFTERSKQLRRNIVNILAQQLHELEQRYDEISKERVSVRLSHQLVRLLNQLGRRVNNRLEIRLSQEELAQLTGTTLYTVSKLLAEWDQRGIVSASRETVQVRDVSFLEKLVESVTGPEETVRDAPLPPQADSYRASLAAADLAGEIKELRLKLASVN